MKTLLNTTLSAMAAMVISFNASASGAGVHLEAAKTDITDQASLQRGATSFMNNCSGCHSIELMRYNRIAKDLNISEADMANNLMFNADKTGSPIFSSMPEDGAKEWFGTTPPDLSLTGIARGTDWIYTYLKGFYADETRPYGVNNHVLENAAMPVSDKSGGVVPNHSFAPSSGIEEKIGLPVLSALNIKLLAISASLIFKSLAIRL